jgi:hypothetical protein
MNVIQNKAFDWLGISLCLNIMWISFTKNYKYLNLSILTVTLIHIECLYIVENFLTTSYFIHSCPQ